MLVDLANTADQPDMADRFSAALEAEEQHLLVVKGWLRALMLNGSGNMAA